VLTKKEVDEPKSILEQIHKDENSVMPPPNLTPRVATGSTPGTGPVISSVSPVSVGGAASVQVGTPGWPTSASTLRNTSAKSPGANDDDKGEDGSEEEEAADLLVYFHARSGGGDSTNIDDSIEVPGDEPHRPRAQSVGASSPPNGPPTRKRRRTDVGEEFGQVATHGIPESDNNVAGNLGETMFTGNQEGAGSAREAGKLFYG
jgi:hypothetical protein